MNLFLSHASEDKPFVRQLAEALRAHHNVWFDEYELSLGDSLLAKIDEGLRKCDYGIVVLSKAFFAKKWPKAELDGLFALESTERKVILPIWKDVAEQDVKAFSPIIAGRLAISAADGIPRIEEAINRAIDIATRVAAFSEIDSISNRLRSVASDLETKKNSQRILGSNEGVKIVFDAVTATFDELIRQAEFMMQSSGLPLKAKKGNSSHYQSSLSIDAPFNIACHFAFGSAYNSAEQAELTYQLFTVNVDVWGHQTRGRNIQRITLMPFIDDQGHVSWKDNRKTVLTNSQLPAFALNNIVTEIEKLTKDRI